jgi:nicotinate-nucleotide--dimethylbenzimidazole phosphoribosyltransferase
MTATPPSDVQTFSDSELSSFAEIRKILRSLPGPEEAMGFAAERQQAMLTKPAGSLGRLEELAVWLARWQGRNPPRVERCATAVFAGNHGVAAQGVSAYPPSVTRQMVQNFIDGGAAVNQLCGLLDVDLKVYELDLDQPTADFTQAPAMSEADCVKAMAYGMMAVEQGIDLLALGEMGIANTTSAAALCHGLFGGKAEDWVGRGTGVDDQTLARKTKVVAKAVAYHQEAREDPLELLRRLGGLELAAMVGAIIAARLARTPVLLDGYVCCAAAAVLGKIDRHLLDHCEVAHRSVEPGHGRLLESLGKSAILDLGMRLGEASGATLAIAILKAAAACHGGMATFEEAGVSGPA